MSHWVSRKKRKKEKKPFAQTPSLLQLADAFHDLDPIRKEIAQSLDGWNPPVVIVIGDESSGKSTLLHRLSWQPYFPRGGSICTRLPIMVSLRSGRRLLPPVLEVINQGFVESTIKLSSSNNCREITECMDSIMKQENQHGKGISLTKQLRLNLSGPYYPNLDLLDTPGLVQIPNTLAGEPETMKEDTHGLARSIIGKYKDRAVFLAIRKITDDSMNSTTLALFREFPEISERVLGVFTHCDTWKQQVGAKMKDPGSLVNFKQGYVATATLPSAPTRDAQAEAEKTFFSSNKVLRQLVQNKKATCGALVGRISDLYANHLSSEWIPKTLGLLCKKLLDFDTKNRELGMPRAHSKVTPTLKKKISSQVNTVMKQVLATQMTRATEKILVPLQNNVLKHLEIVERQSVSLNGYETLYGRVLNSLYEKGDDALASLVSDAWCEARKRLQHDKSRVRVSRFPNVILSLANHMDQMVEKRHAELKARLKDSLEKDFSRFAMPCLALTEGKAQLKVISKDGLAHSICQCLISFQDEFQNALGAEFSSGSLEQLINSLTDDCFKENCSSSREELIKGEETVRKVLCKLLAMHKVHRTNPTLVAGQKVRFVAGGKERTGVFLEECSSQHLGDKKYSCIYVSRGRLKTKRVLAKYLNPKTNGRLKPGDSVKFQRQKAPLHELHHGTFKSKNPDGTFLISYISDTGQMSEIRIPAERLNPVEVGEFSGFSPDMYTESSV